MKIFKSKKATFFTYIVLIAFFLGLSMQACAMGKNAKQFKTKYVGETSLSLLNTAIDAEKINLYVDQSADLAIRQSLYELAKDGGFNGDSSCGRLNGDNVITLNCLPSTYSSFGERLGSHMDGYLEIYEDYELPPGNYDFTLFQQANLLNVMGTALRNIDIKIPYKGVFIGEYKKALRPSFNRLLEFSFDYFRTIEDEALNLIVECFDARDVDKCVEDNKIAYWDLKEKKLERGDAAQTFGSMVSLVQRSEKDRCVSLWTTTNPDLNNYGLVLKGGEVYLEDDRNEAVGERVSLDQEIYYVLGHTDEPELEKTEGFKITFGETENQFEIENYGRQSLGKTIIFYRNEGKIALIDSGELLGNAGFYHGLERCFNLYNFEIDTGTEFFAYDENGGGVKKRPIKIDFAVLIESFDTLDLGRLPEEPEEEQEPEERTERLSIEQIDSKMKEYSQKYGVDEGIIRSMVRIESSYQQLASKCEESYETGRYGPWNVNVYEKYHCDRFNCHLEMIDSNGKSCHKISASYGLMQMLYVTAMDRCRFRGDPDTLYNVDENLDCGVKILKSNIDYCGSVERGVWAYNHGRKYCKTKTDEEIRGDMYIAKVNSNCDEICLFV